MVDSSTRRCKRPRCLRCGRTTGSSVCRVAPCAIRTKARNRGTAADGVDHWIGLVVLEGKKKKASTKEQLDLEANGAGRTGKDDDDYDDDVGLC